MGGGCINFCPPQNQESRIDPWPRYFWKVSQYTSHFFRDAFATVCPPLGRKSHIHHQFVSRYASHWYRDVFSEVLGSRVVGTSPAKHVAVRFSFWPAQTAQIQKICHPWMRSNNAKWAPRKMDQRRRNNNTNKICVLEGVGEGGKLGGNCPKTLFFLGIPWQLNLEHFANGIVRYFVVISEAQKIWEDWWSVSGGGPATTLLRFLRFAAPWGEPSLMSASGGGSEGGDNFTLVKFLAAAHAREPPLTTTRAHPRESISSRSSVVFKSILSRFRVATQKRLQNDSKSAPWDGRWWWWGMTPRGWAVAKNNFTTLPHSLRLGARQGPLGRSRKIDEIGRSRRWSKIEEDRGTSRKAKGKF